MLTGDSRTTAEAVGAQARHRRGDRRGAARPESSPRSRSFRRRAASSRWPATASTTPRRWPQAQVGIAMGTGTDVAMESAGVTLVKGDLQGIVRARRLSRATMRNIRQNLFFAFVFNALGGADRGRRALSGLRLAAQPDDRQRRDEPQLGHRRRQRAAAAPRGTLVAPATLTPPSSRRDRPRGSSVSRNSAAVPLSTTWPVCST